MRKFLFLIFILFVIYLFARTFVGNLLLERNGVCSRAVLINETIRTKGDKASLKYTFTANGRAYEGNSLEEDLDKVADSVCVIYLISFPSVNRPIKYFDELKLNCKCN